MSLHLRRGVTIARVIVPINRDSYVAQLFYFDGPERVGMGSIEFTRKQMVENPIGYRRWIKAIRHHMAHN